jgi:FHA domain
MKQFWTPLAKAFGLTEATKAEPAAPHAQATNLGTSNWPLLFHAFEQFARQHWRPAWQRHAEVSPNEVMSIRRIAIQANDPAVDAQLQSWRAEGSTQQLMNWLVHGPWQSPELQQGLDFSDFNELVFLPYAPAQAANAHTTNAYDDPNWKPDTATDEPLHLIVDFSWAPRPAPIEPKAQTPEFQAWIRIEDGQGDRCHELKGRLFILGQAKEMAWPDGRTERLQNGQRLEWQGEEATYLALDGLHVSGMHLAIRLHEYDIEYMDMGSSNGTLDPDGHALLANVWHRSMGDLALSLGGHPTDAAQESPRLLLSLNPLRTSVSVQATPLRQATRPVQTAQPLCLHLELSGSDGWTHSQAIGTLPFTIGRDPQCQCVVPQSFSKVSRRHLVIEEWDAATESVKIKDISTHGVQIEHGGWSGDPTQGAWLISGSQMVIGKSNHSPCIHIRITTQQPPSV